MSSSAGKAILWTNPRNPKERATVYRAPPHPDGRPRVVCDLCGFQCVVAGYGPAPSHFVNFANHRGSSNCLKRAGGLKTGFGGGGGSGMVKGRSGGGGGSGVVKRGSGGGGVGHSKGKGKITAHFAATPSASSRASSAAVSEALEAESGDEPPRTVSSSSPRDQPMEIDLTSPSPEPSPEPEPEPKKKKTKPMLDTTKARASASTTTTTGARKSMAMEERMAGMMGKFGAGATSYEMAASASSSARSTPHTNSATSTPAPAPPPTTHTHTTTSTSTSTSTPTSTSASTATTGPTCTSCRRPNPVPTYKLCPACRAYSRDRYFIDAERKRAHAALKLAEMGADEGAIARAREGVERAMALAPGRLGEGVGEREREKMKPGRKRKRADPHPPPPAPHFPELVFDPDECGTAEAAYTLLKTALTPAPVKPPRAPLPVPKLNLRLTWAVVADGSVSHRTRIEGVEREVRRCGLVFSLTGKTQTPGSSRYVRDHALTVRYRCKCTSSIPTAAPNTSAAPLARRQSDLSSFFKPPPKGKGKPAPTRMEEEDIEDDVLMLNSSRSPDKSSTGKGEREGKTEAEEKCGGHVYISSEWDVKSHPAGLRGQRVVVWVVHEGGDDPIQQAGAGSGVLMRGALRWT
ncbi:unnamed protein product [Peniophora sp. CBMAI 1063]|nr:unnamed protein product [Peniophora sp. CBMAI 1063]